MTSSIPRAEGNSTLPVRLAVLPSSCSPVFETKARLISSRFAGSAVLLAGRSLPPIHCKTCVSQVGSTGLYSTYNIFYLLLELLL